MATGLTKQHFLQNNSMVFVVGDFDAMDCSEENISNCKSGLQDARIKDAEGIKQSMNQFTSELRRVEPNLTLAWLSILRQGRVIHFFFSDDTVGGDLQDLWLEVKMFHPSSDWRRVTEITLKPSKLTPKAPGWYVGILIQNMKFSNIASSDSVPIYRFGYSRKSKPNQEFFSSNCFIEKNDGRIRAKISKLLQTIGGVARASTGKRSHDDISKLDSEDDDEEVKEKVEEPKAKLAKTILSTVSKFGTDFVVRNDSNNSSELQKINLLQLNPFGFDELLQEPKTKPITKTFEEEQQNFQELLQQVLLGIQEKNFKKH